MRPNSPRTRRGAPAFTLIEAVIASALLLMVLTAIYQTLVLALRYSSRVRDAAEVQQEALTVLNKVERCLSCGASKSVAINPDENADLADRYVLFVSAQTDGEYYQRDSGGGKVLWQRFVLLYAERQTDGRVFLLRRDRTFSPTSNPPNLPTRDNMVSDRALPTQVLTKNLSELEFGDGMSVAITLGLLTPLKNGLTLTSRAALRP